jgi:hypothetical protein
MSTEASSHVQEELRSEREKNFLRPEKVRQFLLRRPRAITIGWIVVLLAFVAAIGVTVVCWFLLAPPLLEWANEQYWHWVPASFAFSLLLFGFPVWSFMGAGALFGYFADISLTMEDPAFARTQEAVRKTEQDAINQLEKKDTAGLLPLLRYSRAQLDAYYHLGLRQTKGSYYNAVIAMWLGFLVICVGIFLYVGPVEYLHLQRPTSDFYILILAGAVIIEFVSALFLWVYSSTTGQLTYYYDLQMHNHIAILCFRIASTMQAQQADETKRIVIARILEWSARPERPPVVGAKGLRALLPKSYWKGNETVAEDAKRKDAADERGARGEPLPEQAPNRKTPKAG